MEKPHLTMSRADSRAEAVFQSQLCALLVAGLMQLTGALLAGLQQIVLEAIPVMEDQPRSGRALRDCN